jgi:hypothetical protein
MAPIDQTARGLSEDVLIVAAGAAIAAPSVRRERA